MQATSPKPAVVPLALSPAGAAAAIGVSRAFLYEELLGPGKLPSFRVGRRRLIRVADLDAFLSARVAAAATEAA